MPNPRKPTRSKPPGGKRRAPHEIQDIFDKIEYLMAYATPKAKIVSVMRKELGVPERTVEEYMRRVRDVWSATAADERATRRERQLRRLYDQATDLVAKGMYKDLLGRERLIAEIEGNLAPEEVQIVRRVGWEDLTPEQLDAIIKTKGKLPPGVTVEQLFAAK